MVATGIYTLKVVTQFLEKILENNYYNFFLFQNLNYLPIMDPYYHFNPILHWAARECDLEKVSKMIEEDDIPVNVKDSWEWVPLHEAAGNTCRFHGPAIVEYLISEGGEVNAKTEENETPLHIAAEKGLQKIVELLLEHGANPAATNDAGETPLDLATKADIKAMLEAAEEERRIRLGLAPVPLIQEPI